MAKRKHSGSRRIVTVGFSVLALAAIFGGSALFLSRMASLDFWNPMKSLRANALLDAVPERLAIVRALEVSPAGLGGGCGGAIYELDSETVRRISAEALAFFEGALHGRAPVGQASESGLNDYVPWSETPFPSASFVEGAYAQGFGCMALKQQDRSAISAAMRAPGSFWSRSRNREIAVLPGLRLVIVTYAD